MEFEKGTATESKAGSLLAIVATALGRCGGGGAHWREAHEMLRRLMVSHEERQRLDTFRVQAALAENNLMKEVQVVARLHTVTSGLTEGELSEFTTCLRSATDAVLFERSQAFAMAVHSGTLAELA